MRTTSKHKNALLASAIGAMAILPTLAFAAFQKLNQSDWNTEDMVSVKSSDNKEVFVIHTVDDNDL